MIKNNEFHFGDVVFADFGAVPDKEHPNHEQAGRRPAVVISVGDDVPGNYLLTVVPITNTHQGGYPFAIELSDYHVHKVTGSILMNQIRTIDKGAQRNLVLFDKIDDSNLLEQMRYLLKIWLDLSM